MAAPLRVVTLCSHSTCFNELDADPRRARVFFEVPGRGKVPAGEVCGAHADELEKATVVVPGLVVERAS